MGVDGARPGPEECAALVPASADEQGRLPVPPQAGWEIFPFEPATLSVRPLEPPVLPEPARSGEGDRPCWACPPTLMPRAHLDLADLDDTHAAELGQIVVRG